MFVHAATHALSSSFVFEFKKEKRSFCGGPPGLKPPKAEERKMDMQRVQRAAQEASTVLKLNVLRLSPEERRSFKSEGSW